MSSRPKFFFFICADSGLLHFALDEFEQKYKLTDWQKKVFWVEQGLDKEFWSELGAANLFGPSKLLIIRQAQNLSQKEWQGLEPYLVALGPKAPLPVFCFEKEKYSFPAWLKKTRLFQKAEQNHYLETIPELNRKTIFNFLQEQLKSHGLKISNSLLHQLAQNLPLDAWVCKQEIEKLSLIVDPSQEVKPEHLAVLNLVMEENIFALVDSLVGNKSAKWFEQRFAYWDKEEQVVFALISLLHREAKLLWMLYFQEDAKINLPAFIKTKKKALSQRLGLERISFLLDLALDCELKIKTGELSPAQTLEYIFTKSLNFVR